MFTFGKKKVYTLGEKERYFNEILNKPNISEKKRNWANKRLDTIRSKKKNLKLGDVMIINDKYVGGPKSKPRAVVIAKVKKNRIMVVPVYKGNRIMTLKNFDGQRLINISKTKDVSKDYLYEHRGFKLKNCNLTSKEKEKLQLKVKQYL